MAERTLYFKYALSMAATIDNSIWGCSDKRPFTVYYKATILDRETLMLAVTSLKVKFLAFCSCWHPQIVALLLKLNASG